MISIGPRKIGDSPRNCPTCKSGADTLIVATRDGPKPSKPFEGQPVTFIGYDCKACGEELRFDD